MNPHHPAPEPAQAEDAAYYRQILHALIDQGANIAKTLHDQITTPENPAPAETTIAFDRIARALRRTILLAQKIAKDAARAATRPNPRTAARSKILREVQDTIQRNRKGAEIQSLNNELLDRLDRPETEDDIATRPVDEIIQEICRDLGIDAMPGANPWQRRTPQDVAALRAQAAQPPLPNLGQDTMDLALTLAKHARQSPRPAHHPGPRPAPQPTPRPQTAR